MWKAPKGDVKARRIQKTEKQRRTRKAKGSRAKKLNEERKEETTTGAEIEETRGLWNEKREKQKELRIESVNVHSLALQ